MYSAVFLCVVGLAAGQVDWQHGHNLRDMVDAGFARIDHNPKDGIVTQAEFDQIENRNDIDHNGCVTYQEYQTSHPHMSDDISLKMYNFIDVDSDHCVTLQDLHAEFQLMDHNTDGQVTLHEFEQFLTRRLNKLLGR